MPQGVSTFGTSHEGYPPPAVPPGSRGSLSSHASVWESRNYIATFIDEEAEDLRGRRFVSGSFVVRPGFICRTYENLCCVHDQLMLAAAGPAVP